MKKEKGSSEMGIYTIKLNSMIRGSKCYLMLRRPVQETGVKPRSEQALNSVLKRPIGNSNG
jgi:hypothetical protein